MKAKSEEERLAERYKAHGVTVSDVLFLVESGVALGLDRKAVLLDLRARLGIRFNEPEYFTAEEMSLVTGQSVEELNQYVAENEEELLKTGCIAKVSYHPAIEGLLS